MHGFFFKVVANSYSDPKCVQVNVFASSYTDAILVFLKEHPRSDYWSIYASDVDVYESYDKVNNLF